MGGGRTSTLTLEMAEVAAAVAMVADVVAEAVAQWPVVVTVAVAQESLEVPGPRLEQVEQRGCSQKAAEAVKGLAQNLQVSVATGSMSQGVRVPSSPGNWSSHTRICRLTMTRLLGALVSTTDPGETSEGPRYRPIRPRSPK